MTEKVQAGSTYLQSAPTPLVRLYEKRSSFPGREILGRLLTDPAMDPVWTRLEKKIRTDREWAGLWSEIRSTLKFARKKRPTRTQEKNRFLKIAEQALELADSIRDGLLDEGAFQLFPAEVMQICGVAGWSSLSDRQRETEALNLLKEWPTAPELLAELAARAQRLGNEAMTGDRVVGRARDDPERSFFVRILGAYFKSKYDSPCYGAVSRIASVVLDREVSLTFVKNEVREYLRRVEKGHLKT